MNRAIMVLALFALAWPGAAWAQGLQRVPTCGAGSPGPGASPGYQDANGNACVSTSPITTNGYGALATSTTSAAINTMTVNAGTSLPASWTNLVAINLGLTDAALCAKGSTCTCPENGVATTNGVTLYAGGGGYTFNLGGAAIATPTIVACSGTPTVQFQW